MAANIPSNQATPAAATTRPQAPSKRSEGPSAASPKLTTSAATSAATARVERQRRADVAPQGQSRPQAPARAEKDKVSIGRADPRAPGDQVQAQNARVSQAQSAGRTVQAARGDLKALQGVAKASVRAEPTADRSQLQRQANEIDQRLKKADRDPGVERARRTEREREAEQARNKADRIDRQVARSPRAQGDEQPQTLTLEPRTGDIGDLQRQAAVADDKAQTVERRVESEEPSRAEAKAPAAEAKAPAKPREDEEFSPKSVDVSSAEAAEKTERAALEKDVEAARLERSIAAEEDVASRRAEASVQEASAARGSQRIDSEAEGRKTAERIRQEGRDNPERFVASQARVSSDAASRLLA
ncbi:MAG: hypothetical protein EXR76_14720 [Myxococcales bacterium]|nr:hypothetical protein [Myxococcales bacterium]